MTAYGRAASHLQHTGDRSEAFIPDVRRETRQRLLEAGLARKVQPGQRIAITAGSRGMGGFVEPLGGVIDAVKSVRGEPLLIPAMGSHGRIPRTES